MNNIDFSKTMLIIGAGAHVPYKYPTAMELTNLFKSLHRDHEVVSSISDVFLFSHRSSDRQKDKVKICRYLREFELVKKPENLRSDNGYDIVLGRELEEFLIAFGESQVYSIDVYLANYLNLPKDSQKEVFPQLGKLLIAYFIYSFEKKVPIGFHEFDWIQYIINQYLKDRDLLEQFLKKPPYIYSFNYDNHFEQSLLVHLVRFHGYQVKEAKERINSLGIKHIYGHIDSLNVGSEVEILKKCLNELLVIGEERSDKKMDDLSREIADSIDKVKKVYFMGFGFDKLNTDLIFKYCPKGMDNACYPDFYSTNIGFTDLQQKNVSDIVPKKIQFFPNKKIDCMELISKEKPIFEKIKIEKSLTSIDRL